MITRGGNEEPTALDEEVGQLRKWFDEQKRRLRFIALLSPT